MPGEANTPTKAEQIQYPVGVEELLIVIKTVRETSTTPPTYADKVWTLPTIKKIGVKGNGKAVDIYASNKLLATVAKETQHELSLSHVGIPIALLDEMVGDAIKKGVSFTTTKAHEFPEFAVGVKAPKSDSVMDVIWYPSCQLDPATKTDWETEEDAFKEQNLDTTILANGLRSTDILFTKYSNARDGEDNLTVEEFTKQVVYDTEQLDALGTAKKPVAPADTGGNPA